MRARLRLLGRRCKGLPFATLRTPFGGACHPCREGKRIRHRFWQPGGGYDRNITSIEALRAMIEGSGSFFWLAEMIVVLEEMN